MQTIPVFKPLIEAEEFNAAKESSWAGWVWVVTSEDLNRLLKNM